MRSLIHCAAYDLVWRLEVKGSQNHTKLINMLEAINDPLMPIEQTFERYFDADNYFNWMAFNILVGHTDTTSQNFYLYSPQNSEKWYFLPWDYDASLIPQVEFDNALEPGIYFWRVIATNESGYKQVPFDNCMDDLNIRQNGLKIFYLRGDGTITDQ